MRIVLVILAVATTSLLLAGVIIWRRPDPLAARLLGAWEIRSNPSGTSERRTIEFHDDGRFWVYPRGERDILNDTCFWRASGGNLIVIFEDPLAQGASAGRKVKEAVRRIGDPWNNARSYRYAVHDDGLDTVSISLVQERGNPPAQVETATFMREVEQPRP